MTPETETETVIHRIVLNLICKVPDPFQSEEDGLRFDNQDLSTMGKAELTDELKRVQLRLLIDSESGSWLLRREEVVKGLIHGARR